MKWEEYKFLSERTLSTEFHCSKDDELLLHAVSGILTEIDELLDNYDGQPDITNIGEEIFDGFWYLCIIARRYNLTLPEKAETSIDEFQIVLEIIRKSIKLLDLLKKKLYYNKSINEDIFIQYSNEIISLFVAYANVKNIDIERGFQINISKLKARYSDKFSSERAINRNLDVEREILEGK